MVANEARTAEALKRRASLSKILALDEAEGRKGPWVVERMKAAGYPKYSRSLLSMDRRQLNARENFTLDLIEKNYSRVMGALDARLESMELAAATIAVSEFPTVTKIHRTVRDSTGNIVQTIDETREAPPDTSTRLKAASLLLQIVKQRYDLYAGQNVHVAAAMLSKKFKVMESEIGALRGKLQPKQLQAIDHQLAAVRKQEAV